jgi:hypothetical protein
MWFSTVAVCSLILMIGLTDGKSTLFADSEQDNKPSPTHCVRIGLSRSPKVQATIDGAQFCWSTSTSDSGQTLTSGSFVITAKLHAPLWVANTVSVSLRLLGPELRFLPIKYKANIFTRNDNMCVVIVLNFTLKIFSCVCK